MVMERKGGGRGRGERTGPEFAHHRQGHKV